jgi:hypothetical protein
MPGRPKLAEFVRKANVAGAKEGVSGEEYLLGRIANGEPMGDIMADFGHDRTFFYMWLKMQPGRDARKAAYEEAKLFKAHSLAEQGQSILDDLAVAGPGIVAAADVSLADKRASYRQWMAGVLNREEYGPRTGASLVVNLGQLHLDALRAPALPVLVAAEVTEELVEGVRVDDHEEETP